MEQIVYLKEDYTGPATRKEYGKAGDALKVLSGERYDEMLLVRTLGSSSATVKTLGSGNLEYSLGDGDCPIIKHLTEKKIYLKTTDFEIVQIN